ncbi:MAG: carbohydrate ABC transporter substrate-binding protein [Myxococcaceae bacterium]|nr:MAG: carbohydrate ABC transporter substrate-binding protein [Myxococcaceae bacterium]
MMSRGLSRRTVLAGASALAAALGPTRRARAAGRKRLRILQWNHFVPAYDRWFDAWARTWGEQHDTDVTVDHVGVNALNGTAAAEVAAGRGHDLVMFLRPRPVHEPDVIDHREIVEECQRRHGKPLELALRSTRNPRTGKFHGFCDSIVPDPVNYRSDLWAEVGQLPDDWDRVRVGGKAIKARNGIPVGIGLSSEDDSGIALRVLLLAFGGSEQDASGAPALASRQTLEAVKYVTALYREAMTPAVLAWDPSSNNRAMIAGQSSLVMNAISITRTAENDRLPIGPKIALARPPRGPARRLGLPHATSVYVIWKFAENVDGAKAFLVDLVGRSREAFQASESYNFPAFPDQVKDLGALLAKDPKATPPDKYAVLADALEWMTNLGAPGHANAAVDDAYGTWVLNTMFARAATGADSAEDAVKQADQKLRQIWSKWKARGLL